MTANKKTNNVDTTKEFTAIEWCAGYGGIHLGLKRAIPNLRVIAYGEIEAFAAANLVAKMEAGLMDPAPLWTDIKTFPCEEFRDRVGLLVAGYPCQPFSAAGKRLGAEDHRHLWPHIARAIGIIRPRLCFFENVEGHISLGLREVIGELGAIGYTAAWGIFSASEVGAPHQRKRVFILAVSNSLGGAAGVSRSLAWNEGIAGEFDHGGGEGGRELADTCHGSNPEDGYAEAHRLPSEHWQEVCSGFAGGANATAWPSRPGEPQHAWEPPRVVGTVPAKLANFCSRDAQQGRDTAQTGGQSVGARREGADPNADGGSSVCGGDQGDEQALANDHRPHAGHGEQRPERTLRDLSGGCGKGRGKLGDSTHQRDFNQTQQDNAEAGADFDRAGEGERMANTHGGRGEEPEHQQASIPTEPSGCNAEAMGNAEELRRTGLCQDAAADLDEQLVESANASGRQTQPSLGRDADGSARGMDYAELQVSCDNRTDELRLLGNGVVPATAERAFRILMEEIISA